jgi:signal peptidase
MMAKKSKPKNNASEVDANARQQSKMTTTVKVVRTTVASLLVIVVLGMAGVAAVALIGGSWQVNPVVSGSMRPGFSVGGVVISERVPVDQLALRDVIEFKNPDTPTDIMVHRIVHLIKNNAGQLVIKTQGDANTIEDPWTLTISGKYAYEVRWSVPLVGYAAIDYQNHRGLVLLGAGIVLLAGAASVVYRPRKRDDSNEEETPAVASDDPPRVKRGFKLGAKRDEDPVVAPPISSDQNSSEFPIAEETAPTNVPSNFLGEPSSRVKPLETHVVVVMKPVDPTLFGIDEDRTD